MGVPWRILVAWALLHAAILYAVNRRVPGPYMDELFHVKQTQTYCAGDWSMASYDPAITTPPGLYAVGAAAARALGGLLLGGGGPGRFCTAPWLRAICAAFNVGTLAVFGVLLRALHRDYRVGSDDPSARAAHAMHAVWLASVPAHFFFGALYYTDAASTFLVLLCYTCAVRAEAEAEAEADRGGKLPHAGWMLASAGAGAASLFFRQTNVVWVVFTVGAAVVRDRRVRAALWPEKGGGGRGGGGPRGVDLAREAAASAFSPALVRRFLCSGACLGRAGAIVARRMWAHVGCVAAAAAWCVARNGGHVVLGHQAHHTPTVHLAQLAFFFCWVALALAPADGVLCARAHLASLRRYIGTSVRGGWVAAALGVGAAAALVLGTKPPTHPFTLADNRHFTFYLWSRVFRRPVVGALAWAALVPAAAYAAWVTASLVRGSAYRRKEGAGAGVGVTPLWWLGFVLATALVLVPAHLVEPRYWTLPALLALAHAPPPPARVLHGHVAHGSRLWRVAANVACMAAVNALTLYVFVARPFRWPDGSEQRFMW